jgi:hypothetical protein
MRLLLPWAAIPLFAAVAYETPNFGGVWLRPSYLCIPLAALLAHRFGRRGLLAAAIGMLLALYAVNLGWPWVDYSPKYENYFVKYFVQRRPLWPLLPMSLRSHAGNLVANWAVFAIALAAGFAASRSRNPIAEFDRLRVPLGVVFAAIALLPVGMLPYREDMGGGFEVFSLWYPLPLLYVVLLALGLGGTRAALIIGALAVATIAGLWFEWSKDAIGLGGYYGLVWDGFSGHYLGQIRYGLNVPAHFFATTACFAVGRALRAAAVASGPQRPDLRPATLLALLLLLCSGGTVYEWVSPWSGQAAAIAHRLRLLGDDLILPVVALYAGAAFRLRGVCGVFAVWIVVTLATLAVVHWGGTDRLSLPLEEPLYVLSFGALGVALGDRMSGSTTVWHPLHWMGYFAVLVLAVPQMFDIQSAADFLLPTLAIAALMLAALVLTWMRRRCAPSAADSAPGAWVALAALAGLTASLGPQLLASAKDLVAAGSATQLLAQFVAELRRDDELSAALLQLAALPACLSVLFLLLTQWLKGLPQMADDVRGIVVWWRHWRTPPPGASTESQGEPRKPDERQPWRRFVARCATVTAWARNIAMAATVAVLVLLAQHALQ